MWQEYFGVLPGITSHCFPYSGSPLHSWGWNHGGAVSSGFSGAIWLLVAFLEYLWSWPFISAFPRVPSFDRRTETLKDMMCSCFKMI